MLIVLSVFLAAGAWFLTDVAPERAVRFDADSRAALEHDDLATAYRRAKFAVALDPTDERRITAGSLAYLAKDYGAARSFFSTLKKRPDPDTRSRALVGAGVAAAAEGDSLGYAEFTDSVDIPSDEASRLTLAFGVLHTDAIEMAGPLVVDQPARSKEAAYIAAIVRLVWEPKLAQEMLAVDGELRIQDQNLAYGRFMQEVIRVREDDFTDLKKLADRTAASSARESREIMLADFLFRRGHYRAATALADRALKEEPLYRDGWNVLAASQIALEKYDAAERSLATSSKLDDAFGYTWYLRAELAKAEGESNQEAEYRAKAKTFGYEK